MFPLKRVLKKKIEISPNNALQMFNEPPYPVDVSIDSS